MCAASFALTFHIRFDGKGLATDVTSKLSGSCVPLHVLQIENIFTTYRAFIGTGRYKTHELVYLSQGWLRLKAFATLETHELAYLSQGWLRLKAFATLETLMISLF